MLRLSAPTYHHEDIIPPISVLRSTLALLHQTLQLPSSTFRQTMIVPWKIHNTIRSFLNVPIEANQKNLRYGIDWYSWVHIERGPIGGIKRGWAVDVARILFVPCRRRKLCAPGCLSSLVFVRLSATFDCVRLAGAPRAPREFPHRKRTDFEADKCSVARKLFEITGKERGTNPIESLLAVVDTGRTDTATIGRITG